MNRPEGDPPWLATMYKPDPRLPPDQQILPTHARRMQQEQWEKEGKTPITYDREFAPLAITPDEGKPPRTDATKALEKAEPEEPKEEEQPTPPVEMPQRTKSPDSRPTTSSGYTTMPRLPDPHAPPRRVPSQNLIRPSNQNPSIVTTQPPVQDESENEKQQKRGCACCIVM